MKKIIFSFSLFFGFIAAVRAQQITATSTAEDCVNFISNLAKSNNGKDTVNNFMRTTYFTGGTFTEIQGWTYTQYNASYHNIDWSRFKSLETSKGKADIYINFSFTTKIITLEQIEIDTKTNLIEKRTRAAVDYFSIAIPFSEESKLKELEAAAKRLSQIVVAKGNIFKTKSSTTDKIKNIEGKSSFEETVNYINTFLKDGANDILFCNTVKFKNRKAIVGEHINGTVYIISSYLWEGGSMSGYPQRTENYRIDLSKVEEIKIVRGEGFIGGCCQFGLWFVEKGQAATPKMHLPLWNYDWDSADNNALKEEKIYKAFNHLRQLCGAPEPISF